MDGRRIVVVGGSAAGPKAAARARRLDPKAQITIVQKGRYLSMASCAYPYYVARVFDDRNALLSTPAGAVRDPAFFRNAKDIVALTETEALAINRPRKTLACRNLASGASVHLPYDKLVLATGATPVRLPVPGADLEGVTGLHTMEDTDFLRDVSERRRARRAVVVGGGLIGVEACEALRANGLEVVLVEMLPQILPFLDEDLARLVENHLRAQGVEVLTGRRVAAFAGSEGRVAAARLDDGQERPCDLAVVAVGVKPNVRLAAEAGLEIGALGGIRVDEFLRTSDPDIYAVGDCIETHHLLTRRPVLAPLGDLANLQGRVAGSNAVLGDAARFPGTLLTTVCKAFEFTVASTGLSERRARAEGFNTVAALWAGTDKPGFMGGRLLVIRVVADAATGRLLGVQAVGPGDAAKRVAVAAIALQADMGVADLLNADLPYAPPYSPPIDPLIAAAHVLENKMHGLMEGISAADLRRRLDAGENLFLLDVRGPDEFEQTRLGLGEKLIPLGALRRRTHDLPADKDREIVAYCKISLRGYEAARALVGMGYTNVKVLEGGLAAWPYPREK